jgi:hypothetical protein
MYSDNRFCMQMYSLYEAAILVVKVKRRQIEEEERKKQD